MSMTIEEIQTTLRNSQSTPYIDVMLIIDSITAIRTEGYNHGWDDAMKEEREFPGNAD